MKKVLVETGDGSHSIQMPDLRESYHSLNGAIQESIHTYLQTGFLYYHQEYPKEEIKVFEMGLGTSLNALLTYVEAKRLGVKVIYDTVEPYPLDEDILKELNYQRFIDDEDIQEVFWKIHQGPWEERFEVSDFFTMRKLASRIEKITLDDYYDVIYYDAFAPSVQPRVWKDDVFKQIYRHTNSNGLLVTYSAQGKFRRSMQRAGFWIEEMPGALGKKEMTRGIKI